MVADFKIAAELWHPSMFWMPETVESSAWREHIPFAFWIIAVHQPRRFVELGTHAGVSYFSFCQAVERLGLDCATYAIDTWRGDDQAGTYDESVYQQVLSTSDRKYSSFSTLIRSTFDEALPYFVDGEIDLLHIDGLHTYDAVKHDFDTWSPLLSKRGIVLFHDINVRRDDFGVFKLFKELSAQYPSFEFAHGYGLGVIAVGDGLNERMRQFFELNADDEAAGNFRLVFSRLGALCTQLLHVKNLAEECGRLSKELSYRDQRIASFEDELRVTLEQLASTHVQLAARNTEVDSFGNERDVALSERDDALSQRDTALNAKIQLEHDLDATAARLRELNRDYEVSRSENEALKHTLLERARTDQSNDMRFDLLDLGIRQLSEQVARLTPELQSDLASLGATIQASTRKKPWFCKEKSRASSAAYQDLKPSIEPRRRRLMPWSRAWSRLRYGRPSGLFDEAWYLGFYEDVRNSRMDPWTHYLKYGRREGRQPNVLFLPAWYLERNPDVAAKGVDPLVHYQKHGWTEKRNPHPFFDTAWYLETNADVRDEKINPLQHFLQHGRSEGRLPNPSFSPSWYLASRPDVAEKGMSAVEHYLNCGIFEGQQWADQRPRRSPDSIGYSNTTGKYWIDEAAKPYTYVPEQRPLDLDPNGNAVAAGVKFSVVVPVYNTPYGLLEKLFRSLEEQWYSHWELILVDDNSNLPHVGIALDRLKSLDGRVKVLKTVSNCGISAATNVALDAADGDYIVFLDHDDELTDNCLFELAKCISETHADFIYSDEDKIDEHGSYVQPFFKPDWSPDTFMSTMYTCHVSCVRRSLVVAIGGLRSEYDGAQDWDFILRVTEAADRISHIPKVLYHWRILPNSIASNLGAKPAAVERSKGARLAALERRGLSGYMMDLEQLPDHSVPVYELKAETNVSIVIPSKNNSKYLSKCVESIRGKTTHKNYEIIIVDNGSTEHGTLSYLEALSRYTEVKIVSCPIAFNFSTLCNVGAKVASGDVIIFLNDDTEIIQPEWLSRLAAHASLPHVGAVGAKLLYGHDRSIQHNGILNLADGPGHAFIGRQEDEHGYFGRNVLDGNWIAVTGACMAVERAKFEEVEGFDEDLAVAYNDVDLSFRLYKLGYYNVCCSTVKLFHHESVSRGHDHLSEEKRRRLATEKSALYTKHPDLYMHDPFFNPNFHANDPHFRLQSRWSGEV